MLKNLEKFIETVVRWAPLVEALEKGGVKVYEDVRAVLEANGVESDTARLDELAAEVRRLQAIVSDPNA